MNNTVRIGRNSLEAPTLTKMFQSPRVVSMRTIEYVYVLSPEGTDRLRVRAHRAGREIVSFVVQYEAYLGETWHPIVRFDTAHGFAHRDRMHPDGRVDKEPLLWDTYPVALTMATEELKAQWPQYRRRYEEEWHGV